MARFLIAWLSLLPIWAGAWEEEKAIEFVMAHNPLIRAYRDVTQAYTPAGSLKQRLYENTSIYAQVGAGGTEYQAGAFTALAGVRVSIPLASPKEKQQFSEKLLQQTSKIEEVRTQVLLDIALLRQYEAELAAAREQHKFFKTKSEWLQERVNKGYAESEVLWDNSQKLNMVAAEVLKSEMLIEAQRRKLAQYAGEQWRELLAYLSGKVELK